MSKLTTLHQKLVHIQSNLHAPKDSWNNFARYNYRSAESILKAVKPHLKEHDLILMLSDQIKEVGDRVYVETTVTLSDGEKNISVTACAREAQTKKGADDSQITGATSSYARKYALCGLFAIDDNKDADAPDYHDPSARAGVDVDGALSDLNKAENLQGLKAILAAAWNNATDEQRIIIKKLYDQRKAYFLSTTEQ